MQSELDDIIKLAKECHTKQAWENLWITYKEHIETTNSSKPIAELFRLLSSDPQSLQYKPELWGSLIKGCLSSWNIELGKKIANHTLKTPSVALAIPISQIYLESGHPSQAREVAARALRLTNLQVTEKLQLDILICNSFAEEGKRRKAINLLEEMSLSLNTLNLEHKDKADAFLRIGRMQYFLGRYQQAGDLFYEAYKIYLTLKDWGSSATTLFNTAACYSNANNKNQEQAFQLIEECRRLSETHNLTGPLSHCESFYGLDAFQHGDYAAAKEHFRKALEYLPGSDKGFRRLHVLSMLALTYLATGRYNLAKRFGRQTLELAAFDQSARFKTRYSTLEASLLWEDGKIEESQDLLKKSLAPFETNNVHTLEGLSALSRYIYQMSFIGETSLPVKYEVEENLKKHLINWNVYKYSLGLLYLNQDIFDKAKEVFEKCLSRARQQGDKFLEACSLLALVELKLRMKSPLSEIDPLWRLFEISVAKLGDTPLKAYVNLIQAAIHYRSGRFDECQRHLRIAFKNPRIGFAEKFALDCWISTIEGRSFRLSAPWQISLLTRFTKIFFAPTIAAIDERRFKVSDHYIVNLEKHPALADLLHYLFLKSNFSATAAEIQVQVWKQSLQSQGWPQKIRNTIMRLRDLVPYTLVPVIIHSETIRLFHEILEVEPERVAGLDTEDEILRLLQDSQMSTSQLSNRLKISVATTKRVLKKLVDSNTISSIKSGRNVVYAKNESAPTSPDLINN